jgi:hypothetical protein
MGAAGMGMVFSRSGLLCGLFCGTLSGRKCSGQHRNAFFGCGACDRCDGGQRELDFHILPSQRFRVELLVFSPYALLVLILLNILSRIDRISLAVFGAYALYLPYALGWAYRTWKLNGGEAAHHAK